MYRQNSTCQITQGDILKGFPIYSYNPLEETMDFLELTYCVVVTQDCDLTQDFNAFKTKKELIKNGLNENDEKIKSQTNKIIPSIMVIEGFPAEQLRTGNHLSKLGVYTPTISKETKTPWKNIMQNETPRYHYLKEDTDTGQSAIVFDFKRYFTVSRDYIYSEFKDYYSISLNELYRENLSQRFANYLSRIGLP